MSEVASVFLSEYRDEIMIIIIALIICSSILAGIYMVCSTIEMSRTEETKRMFIHHEAAGGRRAK